MNCKIEGIKKLEKDLCKISGKIGDDRRIAFKRVGIQLLNRIDEIFKSGGDPPWKPLSETTILQRRQGKGSGDARILQDTGTLRESFTFEATNKQVKAGTQIGYAARHEYGSPQRKMLPQKKKALELTIKVFNNFIAEVLSECK